MNKNRKVSLITGIFGQDGSYLAELLLSKGYDVYGVVHPNLSPNSLKIKQYLHIKNVKPNELVVNLESYNNIKAVLLKIKPDEIYHLAATHQSSQGDVAENILYNKNICITSNILATCEECLKNVKILLAGSCLMFDNSRTKKQNETTPFNSNSLYGLEKIAENKLAEYYRNKGLFVCNAILYNHESSRRPDDFVTKKIVKNMVALKKGDVKSFSLGNLYSQVDWGYAKDYVQAMYLMMQAKEPEDYILSTGTLHSIADFCNICAKILEINDWKHHIILDRNLLSREIKTTLAGDSEKTRQKLGWEHSLNFEELVKLMVNNEINNKLD
jgi:GDPmannose 4,6-dehydratase